jgi:hypothetical protein
MKNVDTNNIVSDVDRRELCIDWDNQCR